MYDKMNEKATHTNWAYHILKRAEIYGIKGNPRINVTVTIQSKEDSIEYITSEQLKTSIENVKMFDNIVGFENHTTNNICENA
jgi:hypothetical protein